jgi:hypothetical protein
MVASASAATDESPADPAPWLRRPAASDRFFEGTERVSTAHPAPTAPPPAWSYRAMAPSAIAEVAVQLAIPLFVGRPDPALSSAPVDRPAVIGR